MEWQTIRRETGLVEHVCQHGIGHPNAGSIIWMEEKTGQDGWGVHGCDGCCTRDNWPGTLEHAVRHCHKIIGERNARILVLARETLDLSMELHVARRPWWRRWLR